MTIQGESRGPTILRLSNFDHGLRWLALFLFILLPATAELPNVLPPPPPDPFSRLKFDRNMAIIMVVLVVIFFLLGFLSVYTRQCADRRMRGRLDLTIPVGVGGRRSHGLDPEIIDTFPTFVYSAVKGLKMGRNTLECAVCLNEFEDDETLRLIPKCSHVFHPHCIDIWLGSHSTCPVCRANLIPRPGETSSIAVQIPNPCVGSQELDQRSDSQEQHDIVDDNRNTVAAGHPNRNRPPRSRSTGFRIAGLLPRSHSTGHSLLVEPGENWERFTLRLPEEARKRLLNMTVNRTNSCVEFTRESSERRGYRTRSVGSELGRNYLQYERLDSEGRPERWGFTMRPPFLSRNGSAASNKDEVGERSSDPLCPGSKD